MQRHRGIELRPLGPRGWKSKGRQHCAFEGCDRFVKAHKLCGTHLRQQERGVELRAIRLPKPTAEEGMLWCSTCCQFRDEDEFGWDTVRDQPKRECNPCHNDMQLAYVAANREKVNLRRRLNKRGITEEQYLKMLEQQENRCAICRKERALDIDHCHTQGHVRGLLCSSCNRALGFLEDDPVIIESALEYLRAHGD